MWPLILKRNLGGCIKGEVRSLTSFTIIVKVTVCVCVSHLVNFEPSPPVVRVAPSVTPLCPAGAAFIQHDSASPRSSFLPFYLCRSLFTRLICPFIFSAASFFFYPSSGCSLFCPPFFFSLVFNPPVFSLFPFVGHSNAKRRPHR